MGGVDADHKVLQIAQPLAGTGQGLHQTTACIRPHDEGQFDVAIGHGDVADFLKQPRFIRGAKRGAVGLTQKRVKVLQALVADFSGFAFRDVANDGLVIYLVA